MFAPKPKFAEYLAKINSRLSEEFEYQRIIHVHGLCMTEKLLKRSYDALEFCLTNRELFDITVWPSKLYFEQITRLLFMAKREVPEKIKYKVSEFLTDYSNDEQKQFLFNQYLCNEKNQRILARLIKPLLKNPSTFRLSRDNVIQICRTVFNEPVMRLIADVGCEYQEHHFCFIRRITDRIKGTGAILARMYLIDNMFPLVLGDFASKRKYKCFTFELVNQLRLGILFQLNWIYENTDVPKDVTKLIGEYIAPDLEMKEKVKQENLSNLDDDSLLSLVQSGTRGKPHNVTLWNLL